MKKTLFTIIGIFLILILMIFYFYYNSVKLEMIAQSRNKEFEKYTQGEIIGSNIITAINKAIDENNKNKVEKDENGYYLNNKENSIKIEIKFLESDKTFPMENIEKLGSEEFIKNYGSMLFQCTKKEYHEKTKAIAYILYEQI